MQKQRHIWTAATTRWREEQRAAANLERQGFVYYLPIISEWRLSRKTREDISVRTLLFPGYIFVRLREGWQSISSTRGIARLFLQDERPIPVCSREIERLRRMEDEDGVVCLLPRLRVGDAVVIGDGGRGFAGLAGIVQGMSARDRCRVLLDHLVLGRKIVLDMESADLALAA